MEGALQNVRGIRSLGPRSMVGALFDKADIRVDGDRPWDIQVHDQRLYSRIVALGSLGFGEAYVDGWWDCAQLDELIVRLLRAGVDRQVGTGLATLWVEGRARLLNLQSRWRAWRVGEQHYDLDHRLFECMLDRRLTYTCGYWREADNLDDAQTRKLDLVCRKLGLSAGQRVLDIGCGWGSFAEYAAERYGAHVVGVTISREQAEFARARCRHLPVEIRLQDYRDVHERFDHVVSLGMFEHVGNKNYRTYMNVVRRCLRDDGLFLLHTIGSNETSNTTDAWIDRYIFPNGQLPSITRLGRAVEGVFTMEDWHNFGPDYDRTLMAWHGNFTRHWPELQQSFAPDFFRTWSYYLLSCAGSFRARRSQLWQLVLSPEGRTEGYRSVR